MKNITIKLSALAIGAAILSTAGAATTNPGGVATHAVLPMAPTTFYGKTTMSLQTWDVNDNGSIFLALCVEPGVALNTRTAVYSNNGDFTFSKNADSVARLYSNFYSGITNTLGAATGTAAQKNEGLAFQLALWEIYKDDSSLTATTGSMYFPSGWTDNSPASKLVLDRAATMIGYATNTGNAVVNHYAFTEYTLKDSQTIVSAHAVSAVPEPSTYAMLGLGLALVGFTARRRKQG